MDILDLLGQLLGVIASLDEKWTKALLHRSQLNNPRFLGVLLNSFQIIESALRRPPSHYLSIEPFFDLPLLVRFEAAATHDLQSSLGNFS